MKNEFSFSVHSPLLKSEMNFSVKHEAGEVIKEARLGVDSKLRMLEGTARILSENYGVQVVFSDDGECKTSTERMTLPYDEAVDEALIMGLMGHETGHLKDTNFDVARTIARMRATAHRELLFNICNCLEDVRIEYIMENLYIGFKSMFRRMVPYIQERKLPLIELEELRLAMKADGKTEQQIEAAVKQKNIEDLKKLREELSKDYTDKLVDELIASEKKRRENGHITELQKIMDLVYIKLRGYDGDWYPADVNAFVDQYIIPVAKQVLDCKTTQEVLKVAEEVYEILTNEKGTQVEEDKKRQEMIRQMQQQGKGKGSGSGSGSGQQGKNMSKDEVDKANQDARERERKAREERQKKREQGADVEDFVKNKQGEEGKEEEGEGKGEEGKAEKKGEKEEKGKGKGTGTTKTKGRKFEVGQTVGSLDHSRKGKVKSVEDLPDGTQKVEIDWE